jgi:hypothetical protein
MRLTAAACLALVLGAGAAGADTFVVMDSEPGDYIGQGQDFTLTPAGGTFSAVKNYDSGVTVNFSGANSWSFAFAAAGDAPLGTGMYEGAIRWPFQGIGNGLSVSGAGRGCNTLTGRFYVHEVIYAGDGTTITSFAADFEQHCEGGPKALYGAIRFNSTVPVPDADSDSVMDIKDNCPSDVNPTQADADGDRIGDACDPIQGSTFIHFDSQAGDYIGQGQRRTWTLADGTLTARRITNGVQVNFSGGSTTWSLSFVAPASQPLALGSYEGAARYPFQSSTQPGLDVGGSGRGCNTLTGRFDVLELEIDAAGVVRHFAADFEQHCEGGTPALFGVVRFNAETAPNDLDQDDDGVIDVADNCPAIHNVNQANGDNDEFGDACDPYPSDADNLAACLVEVGAAEGEVAVLQGEVVALQGQVTTLQEQVGPLQQQVTSLSALVRDTDVDGLFDQFDACAGTPASTAVDSKGCSLVQFCAAAVDSTTCKKVDWKNDEPLVDPADCAWQASSRRCLAR